MLVGGSPRLRARPSCQLVRSRTYLGLGAGGGRRCGPGGEDAQSIVGGAPRFGGEDHQSLSASVGAVPHVAVERQVADDRMSVVLASVRCRGDLVRSPPGAEVLVLDRQLADERGERGIVGILGGLHPQSCDGAARRFGPGRPAGSSRVRVRRRTAPTPPRPTVSDRVQPGLDPPAANGREPTGPRRPGLARRSRRGRRTHAHHRRWTTVDHAPPRYDVAVNSSPAPPFPSRTASAAPVLTAARSPQPQSGAPEDPPTFGARERFAAEGDLPLGAVADYASGGDRAC